MRLDPLLTPERRAQAEAWLRAEVEELRRMGVMPGPAWLRAEVEELRRSGVMPGPAHPPAGSLGRRIHPCVCPACRGEVREPWRRRWHTLVDRFAAWRLGR